ncbi:MAG TPA: NAD(P)H-dependent oxidoreductase [Clostridia bacterium]|nr:NAD(P)H-dependent oxidoreductase [Clostridia bacterium]
MKVLAIIGSPRKGNSYKITQRIEEKLKGLGDIEFNYIFLNEIHLETCRGCFACISKGENFCPLKDDRVKIEEQMQNSNGVIFVSPNYCNGATSIMKNFIERLCYIGHRPRFFNQFALAIATSAGPIGLKETLFDLSYFGGGGFHYVKKLGIMVPPFPVSSIREQKIEKQITDTATKFYSAMKNKKRPTPRYIDIIHFHSFKAMYTGFPSLGKEYFPADYNYWTERGWLKKNKYYFTDANVSIFKKAFGKLFGIVIKHPNPIMSK